MNKREKRFTDSIGNRAAIDRGMTAASPDPMIPATLEAIAPPRWEYKSVLLARQADINSYGAAGWELISVIPQPGDNAMFYFRRPKQDSAPARPSQTSDPGMKG